MATFRQLVYLVSDEMKNVSDDSIINNEHILFVLDKYRAYIMKQYYENIKRKIPASAYQTICLNLEEYSDGICSCGYLRSIEDVPDLMPIGSVTYLSNDIVNPNFSNVSEERFKYAGSGKYAGNTIYANINEKLYLKSNNPLFMNLEKIQLRGVFEDSAMAAELACDRNTEDGLCDPLDSEFPMEAALIPSVVELTLKELLGAAYRPADNDNNANDDLSDLRNFITRNMKNSFQRHIDGN